MEALRRLEHLLLGLRVLNSARVVRDPLAAILAVLGLAHLLGLLPLGRQHFLSVLRLHDGSLPPLIISGRFSFLKRSLALLLDYGSLASLYP